MRNGSGWLMGMALLLLGGRVAAADDRTEAIRRVVTEMQSAGQQLIVWADFVDRMEAEGWAYRSHPSPGVDIRKDFNATERDAVKAQYLLLKQSLRELLNQLP